MLRFQITTAVSLGSPLSQIGLVITVLSADTLTGDPIESDVPGWLASSMEFPEPKSTNRMAPPPNSESSTKAHRPSGEKVSELVALLVHGKVPTTLPFSTSYKFTGALSFTTVQMATCFESAVNSTDVAW